MPMNLSYVTEDGYSKEHEHCKDYTERLQCIRMNTWYDLPEDTMVMRVPGFLLYRVAGRQIVQVPFIGKE